MCLGLYPLDNDTSKWMKMARHILPSLFIITLTCAIWSCLSFIIKFTYVNMEATLFTFMCVVVYVGLLSVMIIAFFSRSEIIALFDELSKIDAPISIQALMLSKIGYLKYAKTYYNEKNEEHQAILLAIEKRLKSSRRKIPI